MKRVSEIQSFKHMKRTWQPPLDTQGQDYILPWEIILTIEIEIDLNR